MPWWAYLAYALVLVGLFPEVVFGGQRFIDRDLLHYFYPLAQTVADAWDGQGSFLWDSRVDHGLPLNARWVAAVSAVEHQRWWQHNTLLPNINGSSCVRHADGYGAPELHQHAVLLDALSATPDRFLTLLGVQYVLARPGGLPPGYPVKARSAALAIWVYENKERLPFAYAVPRALRADDLADAAAQVSQRGFPHHELAVLEGDLSLPTAPGAKEAVSAPRPHAPDPDAPGQVRLVTYRAGAITLEAELKDAGYLVVLESFYPGWRACLDGTPVPIYRANAAFMGLAVPAGRHRVVMTFDPWIQPLATSISLARLAALALYGVFVLARRRGR